MNTAVPARPASTGQQRRSPERRRQWKPAQARAGQSPPRSRVHRRKTPVLHRRREQLCLGPLGGLPPPRRPTGRRLSRPWPPDCPSAPAPAPARRSPTTAAAPRSRAAPPPPRPSRARAACSSRRGATCRAHCTVRAATGSRRRTPSSGLGALLSVRCLMPVCAQRHCGARAL